MLILTKKLCNNYTIYLVFNNNNNNNYYYYYYYYYYLQLCCHPVAVFNLHVYHF
jgi:hypothetical protein